MRMTRLPGSRTCSLTLWTDMRVQAVGRRATRFVAALWFFAAVSIVCAAEVFGSGLAVSMTTDKAVYAPGEPIRINLEVANV